MLPDLETLRRYEEEGWVKSSEGPNGLTVWCYTLQTVTERHWDDTTRACRGLVYDRYGDLISRPFTKFFNHGEPEAVTELTPFVAFDKMDGTLIVVGERAGEAVVSTKGSFATWHSEAARELLLGWAPPEGVTVMFELIHPANRIVVDYGDYTGLIFLGAVNNETGADLGSPEEWATKLGWHGDVVVQRSFHLPTMLATIANPEAGPNREGFVIVWPREDGPWNRVKLKFAQYFALHSIYTGLTNRRVWEHLMADSLDELLALAPDELHDDIHAVANEIHGAAAVMYQEAHRVAQDARTAPDRKGAAEIILQSLERPLTGMAFKILDDKNEDARLIAIGAARPEVSQFVGSTGLS